MRTVLSGNTRFRVTDLCQALVCEDNLKVQSIRMFIAELVDELKPRLAQLALPREMIGLAWEIHFSLVAQRQIEADTCFLVITRESEWTRDGEFLEVTRFGNTWRIRRISHPEDYYFLDEVIAGLNLLINGINLETL